MSLYYIIYHGLILIALVIAFISFIKGQQSSGLLALLLFATLAVELFVHLLYERGQPFVWAYHGFVVLEYGLLVFYYAANIGFKLMQKLARWSVPLFAIFSLAVSWLIYRFNAFPGINLNVEGIILFLLYTHLLFNLDVADERPIFKHPQFWIALGILAFFGGTFLFHGIYTPLFDLDQGAALKLFGIINRPLNLFLYGCLIAGLLCTLQKTKLFLR